jgi:hypothetical protein
MRPFFTKRKRAVSHTADELPVKFVETEHELVEITYRGAGISQRAGVNFPLGPSTPTSSATWFAFRTAIPLSVSVADLPDASIATFRNDISERVWF